MTVPLDSAVLIDHVRNPGFDASAAVQALPLLDSFVTLPIATRDADLAAELRRAYRWKLPDALRAAPAVRHGVRLATRNTKDVDPDTRPFVTVPYLL